MAIVAIHNLEIHEMDVKTTFYNVNWIKMMQQPEGFIVKGQENKVCKLIKSLYGRKQALKQCIEG